MSDREDVLHNMSVPPRSTIHYRGLDHLVTHRGFPGGDLRKLGYDAASPSQPTLFVVALEEAVSTDDPVRLLGLLGVTPEPDASAQLTGLIEARARDLPLPDACALASIPPADVVARRDLLTTLAVLTKCSARVWLRAKQPALASAFHRRAAALLVPTNWAERARDWPT